MPTSTSPSTWASRRCWRRWTRPKSSRRRSTSSFRRRLPGSPCRTLEARLASRVGLRQDVKRVPLFGLGCVAGAAGLARMHDYLRAFPDQVAALLAVELCSLTIQREDNSMANLVASSLFGDGAAAVIAKGADRAPAGPRVLATRSRPLPRHRRRDGLEHRQRRVPDRLVRRGRDRRREIPGRRRPQVPRRPRADHRGRLDVGLPPRRPEGDRGGRERVGPTRGCPRPHQKLVARQRQPVIGVGAGCTSAPTWPTRRRRVRSG